MHQHSSGISWQKHLFASTRNRIVLLAILVISLILGVASREALASSHNDPINGCYDTNSGVLRYLDTGTCRNNEVALSWPSMDDFEALQAALAEEATQRQAADAALQAEDAALAQQIADEAAQRQAADAAIQAENAALSQQIADLQAAVDAEIAARQAGDTTLQAALDAEIADREAGDIQTLLDANAHTDAAVAKEATARKNMGNELQVAARSMAKVIGLLMNGDFVGAWDTLVALAEKLLPEPVYKALVAAGNFLGPKIEAVSAKIEEILGVIQAIWDAIFG